MSYNHRVVNGVEVVEIDEAIDLYSTPIIKKFLKTLVNGENRKIILSMENVSFIDSSGLGMLVNLGFECRQKGITLKLANINPESMRIIALGKKQDKFDIYPTLTAAIESFS